MKPGFILPTCLLLLAALFARGYSAEEPAGLLPANSPPPEEPDTVLVAAVQYASRLGEVEENRRGLRAACEQAARAGAKIVVLPEAAVTGYASQEDVDTNWHLPGKKLAGLSLAGKAEPVPGASTAAFGKLARRQKLYVTVPLLEHDARQDKYYNTLVLVGPDGRSALHYRKLHPWPRVEAGWAAEGDRGLAVLDTDYGRLGLMICYDVHQVLERLAREKVDTVLYAIAWVDSAESVWFSEHLPERARLHRVNLVCANWSVEREPQSWHGYGSSCVINAEGQVVARARCRVGNEIVYARLPLRRRAAGKPAPGQGAE